MTAHAIPRHRARPKSLTPVLPIALLVALMVAAGTFIIYLLWPTWPKSQIAHEAPAIPITVAGVLFNVPPASIRAAVQRQPGAHERIDLAFLWPSLHPPAEGEAAGPPVVFDQKDGVPVANTGDRLFVTIAGLGAVLPPVERLRTIYPRYFATQAAAGPDGLAILPFRAGTPYEGEDFAYVADKPEQFFARCTRAVRNVPGTCIYERAIATADVSVRFSREWLENWRGVASSFDQLIAQLHPHDG